MLNVVAWIIEVLSVGAEVYAIVRLAGLRKRLRGKKNWRSDGAVRKWSRIGSVSYAVAILNFITFVIAGTSLPGIYLCGVGFVLMFPLVILGPLDSEGAGE